jgi:hypothetical protein
MQARFQKPFFCTCVHAFERDKTLKFWYIMYICRSLWFFLWEPPLSRKPWRWVWKSITIWRSVCTLHEFPSSKMYHLNFLKLQSCQTKPFHYSVAKLCFLPVIKWVLLLET